MQIHNVVNACRPRPKKLRVGKGIGSGLGKTSGRGQKGAGARAGYSNPPGFEGGTMPLYRRTPKRGFSNQPFKKYFIPVNLGTLSEKFKAGETVDPATLKARGIATGRSDGIKILGGGKLDKALSVKAHAFSESAAKRIVEAGGTVEELK